MHRRFAKMALVIATILGILTLSGGQFAGAASTPARGNGSAARPSGTDAAECEFAPVRVQGLIKLIVYLTL